MFTNVKNGIYDLQIMSVTERTSQAGRDYISLRLATLSGDGSGGSDEPQGEQMYVNFMKEYRWALDKLKEVLAACKVSRLGELTGKRLTAEVVVKNGFTNLKDPRPYVEREKDLSEDSVSGNEEEIPW